MPTRKTKPNRTPAAATSHDTLAIDGRDPKVLAEARAWTEMNEPWKVHADPPFKHLKDPHGKHYREDSRTPEFRALPKSALLVWCALITYFNDETKAAWPSLRTLGQDTGMLPRHVARALRQLEAAGMVTRQGTTPWGTNIYVRGQPRSLSDRKKPKLWSPFGGDPEA